VCCCLFPVFCTAVSTSCAAACRQLCVGIKHLHRLTGADWVAGSAERIFGMAVCRVVCCFGCVQCVHEGVLLRRR
jgi:hypothetical protein